MMAELCVVTQRSGPLTKTSVTDRHSRILWATRQQCRASPFPAPLMWSDSEDKLELYLALFGYHGAHYVLTFRDEDLPPDFGGVKRCFSSFLKRVRRWSPEVRRYIYAVEAGHERGRWHIHFVADERELPMPAMEYLWRFGMVNPGYLEYPVLCRSGGYRRLAHYFCKRDTMIPLGKHPWGVARGMRQMIPPPTVRVTTRRPPVPRETFWSSARVEPMVKINGQWSERIERSDWIAMPGEHERPFLVNRLPGEGKSEAL